MQIDNYNELAVVDLECTCCDDESFPRDEMEIIEIGLALYDVRSLKIVDRFETVVQPVRHPTLTKFCKSLTHISQDEVDNAPILADAIFNLEQWLGNTDRIAWGSWGAFDKYKLADNCKFSGIRNPLGEVPYINFKEELKRKLGMKRGLGVKRALTRFDLKFEGNQHRALPDAINTGRLLPYIYR